MEIPHSRNLHIFFINSVIMLKNLRILVVGAIFAGCAFNAHSQFQVDEQPSTKGFYLGVSGGTNWSSMRFSDLDDKLYPENNNNLSGVFSVFGQINFGKNGMFGIRPELAFLTRGGSLTHIGKSFLDEYTPGDADNGDVWLDNYYYRLKATYFDIRVPLIYTIGKDDWRFRPYVYVAPILGIAHRGNLRAQYDFTDNVYEGYQIDLNNSNYNSIMFAGAVGVGVNYYFNINSSRFFLGLEANYQHGFTDTYSKKEKDGKVPTVMETFPDKDAVKASGTRSLSGWELKATLGIPMSVFSSKKKVVHYVEEQPVYVPPVKTVVEPIPQPATSEYEEKPCYTLQEVTAFIKEGRKIEGLRICAIEDIQFDINKADIKKNSYSYLNDLATLIKNTGAKVKVYGHTDNTGTDEINDRLSQERAEAVVKYLERRGVNPNNLSSASYGSRRPRASNDTEQGRRLNRRVEFDFE